jgi:VanZ family protein
LKNKKTSVLVAIGWFIITTILLCIPGKKIPKIGWLQIPHFDKLVHIFIFGLLSYFFCRTTNRKWFLLVAFICTFYGVAMEFVQEYWIPNRSFDVFDIAADTVGSFAAILLLIYFNNNKKKVH